MSEEVKEEVKKEETAPAAKEAAKVQPTKVNTWVGIAIIVLVLIAGFLFQRKKNTYFDWAVADIIKEQIQLGIEVTGLEEGGKVAKEIQGLPFFVKDGVYKPVVAIMEDGSKHEFRVVIGKDAEGRKLMCTMLTSDEMIGQIPGLDVKKIRPAVKPAAKPAPAPAAAPAAAPAPAAPAPAPAAK